MASQTCILKTCEALKKLREVLHFYQCIQETNGNDQSEIGNLLTDYIETNKKNVVNNYHHLLLNHLSKQTERENAINYEAVNSFITKQIKCELMKCVSFKRHLRERCNQNESKNDDKQHDEKAIYYIDLLDNIHTFLVHGYDTGFRVKPDYFNNNASKNDLKEDDDHDINQLSVDNQFVSLQKQLHAKRQYLRSVVGLERINNNKFFTNFSNDDENNNNEESKENEEEKKEIEYSFGVGFYYWDWYKNNDSIDNGRNGGTGYKYSDWFIKRKCKTLKEEILNKLDITNFNENYTKCKAYLEAESIKKMASRKDDGLRYGINEGTPLSIDNLVSITFYTDFSALSTVFSASFRKHSPSETDENFKERHSNWCNWSKLLHETVHLFGNILNDNKNPKAPNINVLYHGVSFIYFSSFVTKFFGPTSMTTSLSVATIFAKEDGIVVDVEQCQSWYTYNPFYFRCNLMSNYTNEDEMLFIGGSGYRDSNSVDLGGGYLQLRSIRCMTNGEEYFWWVHALSLLEIAISGQQLDKNVRKEKFIKKISWYYKGLRILLDTKCEIKTKIEHPQYIQKCFNKLVDGKERLKISLSNMDKYYPSFKKLFTWSSKCNYLLCLDFIADIFRNCKKIKFICNEITFRKEHQISKIFMNEVIEMLNKMNNKKTSKLETITYSFWYFNDDTNYDSLFAKQNDWDIKIKQHQKDVDGYTITLNRKK